MNAFIVTSLLLQLHWQLHFFLWITHALSSNRLTSTIISQGANPSVVQGPGSLQRSFDIIKEHSACRCV